MKTLYWLLTCLLFATSVLAQDEEALKKIEAARIALITERLELTPEQAEKFWPVYREYTEQRKSLLKEYQSMKNTRGTHELSEEESRAMLDKGMKIREQQLALEKTYSEKLNRVISNNQLLQLRRAEEDFRKMIIQRLDNRRQQRERLNRREERRNNE